MRQVWIQGRGERKEMQIVNDSTKKPKKQGFKTLTTIDILYLIRFSVQGLFAEYNSVDICESSDLKKAFDVIHIYPLIFVKVQT